MNGFIALCVVISSLFICCESINCDRFNEFTPCACRIVITNKKIRQSGKTILLEFVEAKCVKEENERRKKEGYFGENFECAQLTDHRTIYRDQEDNPVKVDVKRWSGCELRCINRGCRHPSTISDLTQGESNDHKTKEFKPLL